VRALEDELHDLYRMAITTSELQELIEENEILRDILLEYKIPISPGILHRGERWVEVAVIGDDGPNRHLQVKIWKGDGTPLLPPCQQNGRSSVGSTISMSEADVTFSSIFSPPDALRASSDAYPLLHRDQSLETAYTKGLGSEPSTNPVYENPDSLVNYDLAQLGVDFVLS
jgi:hypothetical protein